MIAQNDRSATLPKQSWLAAHALFKLLPNMFIRATLRTKTLLMIGVTFIILLLLMYIPLRLVVLGSFITLEEQRTRQDVERASNALGSSSVELNSTARGYTAWDDTYSFIDDSNAEYISANFSDESFINNRISLVLIINTDGKVVFGKAFDLNQQQEQPLPQLLQKFDPNDNLLQHRSDESGSTTGLLMLPEGPLLIAAQPILTSAYTGPAKGTLIMGRGLDVAEIQRLSEVTQLKLNIYPIAATQLPQDVLAARAVLSAATPFAQPLSEQTIAGYSLLDDVYGTPSLILRVEEARTIYAEGSSSVRSFGLLLLVGSLLLGVLVTLLLERTVLSRLARLSADVDRVGTSSDLTTRLPIDGNDELASLARAINAMLSALEQSQTEGKQTGDEQIRLQDQLIRAKDQFSQMIVHDLKNPLTGLTGFLHILGKTPLSPSQQELLEGAQRSSSSIQYLIDDILDTAQLEEGELKLHRKPGDLLVLLQGCAIELGSWADQGGHVIEIEADPTIAPVWFDQRLLRRVMINLIGNALKHTPRRTKITLGIDSTTTSVRLWVRDTGPGIPLEQQGRLFKRFSASASHGEHQSNTGLGLAFCKLATEAHGGSIALESVPGAGCTFIVTLPLREVSTPALV